MTPFEGQLAARLNALDRPASIAWLAGLGLVTAAVAASFGPGPAIVTLIGLGVSAVAAIPPHRPAAPPAAGVQPRVTDNSGLIDAFTDPVLIVDHGKVIASNEAARSLLGAHIVGADVRAAFRDPTAIDALAGGTTAEPVELGQLGPREMLWEMRARPLPDGRQIVHLTDRSQRLAFERARTEFVANASHELRTPLAAILGFVETLADPRAGGDAATRARFLGVIQSEARRMQALVEDLMSLSRIEADKFQRPTTTINLTDIARQAADELRDTAGRPRENLEIQTDPNAPPILGDRTQLLQVVHNLIDNAQKYGRPGGKIAIDVRPIDRDRVRLMVSDEGDGIAPEHLPRLTERFYRVDAGRSRAGGGTGLGLAIVKHIVERHRGRLAIDSKLGAGTTVTISFPAVGCRLTALSAAPDRMS
ncbi:MAG: ATPase [Alphaproteobacteria bacterium]|nr:ATPase [Alphaproteobacteria bacterium]